MKLAPCPSGHPINVASVPQRSPFRYPGGKTWLVPHVRLWLCGLDPRPTILIEPFAGGSIVGLTAAFEQLTEHVILVELDSHVAAVWQTIIGGDADWLAERILSFDLTYENVRATLSRDDGGLRERAFRTILKNRTFYGGIMAPGSSLLKRGENGKGIKSRWYADTLVKRIMAIDGIRHRFTFIFGDGIEVMRTYSQHEQTAFFIDPPYTAVGTHGRNAGVRMYSHHEVDHELIFEAAERAVGDVLLTYDDDPNVRDMAARHSFQVESVAMKTTHHARRRELLICPDLQWKTAIK